MMAAQNLAAVESAFHGDSDKAMNPKN
jgi:hypothetical protein